MRKFMKIFVMSLITSLFISTNVLAAPHSTNTEHQQIQIQVHTQNMSQEEIQAQIQSQLQEQLQGQEQLSTQMQELIKQQLGQLQDGSISGENCPPSDIQINWTQGSVTIDSPFPGGSSGTDTPTIDSGITDQLETDGSLTQSSDLSYLYLQGDVSDDQYTTFMNYYLQVDESLRSAFEQDGWELILTSADLDDLLFQGQTTNVVGCTDFTNKVIYVNSGDYSYCVIHEMGHFLDYLSEYASQTVEFQALFESEAAALTEYGQTSSEEFFAEVYQSSILEPDATISACPNAYNYIMTCLDSISQ